MDTFDYSRAFERNIGWLSPSEQSTLSRKRIAIPGLGGVGGHHLHNLLRLGFQNFNISDLDVFTLQNFNRQLGATCDTIGKPKIEVLAQLAKSINPRCDLRLFEQGISAQNQAEFLSCVDLVIDSLDLYAMDERIALYGLAHRMGIPVVTAGPFGMGTSVMAFNPRGMSFNSYFDLEKSGLTTEARIIRFLAGITPSAMHRSYMSYPEALDLFAKRLPSLSIGCDAATAALGSMVVRILLDRPGVRWAPCGFHVDFYLQKTHRFRRIFGNRNPLQKLRIKAYHAIFEKREYQ